MKILIKGGRVIDPANKIDKILDILIESGKISQISAKINTQAERIIDAKGKIVMPGLIDMHVHLREPGREDKETVASGTKAAIKGGVTTVLAMPNTFPAIDCAENVKLLQSIIKKSACVNVLICASITKERLGQEITDITALKKLGVYAISDDGASVDDEKIMLAALKAAKLANMLVICHCEDKTLTNKGVINLGFMSTKLGLRGISKESEYKRIERDIALAKKADAAIHIAHISCKESVEIIRQAKKSGIKITCETAPHYFYFTDESVAGFDTNMKMNPPLRGNEDVAAIKQGLKDKTIDAIASDHAPHTENEKDIEFERAEFGIVGLETELAAGITELVHSGLLNWLEFAEKISFNPAKILGLDYHGLKINAPANLIIIDPDAEWLVEKSRLISKSKNSAFIGKKLKSVVEYTFINGKIVYQG